MKKLKLDAFSPAEFRGLGIVSSEKDYRICFFLNKELDINLAKSEDISIFDPSQNKNQSVLCYIHQDAENGSKLYFMKNRQDGFFVVPEMKQADFIFMEPGSQPDKMTDMKKTISKISQIQGCFIIPPQNLKHIDAE